MSISRTVLDGKLGRLQANIVRMTSMVEQMIEQAVSALNTRSLDLARELIAQDANVNALRYEIEQQALLILATQQPTAQDLRTVIATIHIATELERIGDHASGVSQLMLRDPNVCTSLTSPYIIKMGKRVRKMLRRCVDAYIAKDVQMALELITRDEKNDKNYQELISQTFQQMQDGGSIPCATYLLWMGHNLERVGDRAVNIAERVIFMVTGEFIETPSAEHSHSFNYTSSTTPSESEVEPTEQSQRASEFSDDLPDEE